MNYTRGFFRGWVILSVLWAGALFVATWLDPPYLSPEAWIVPRPNGGLLALSDSSYTAREKLATSNTQIELPKNLYLFIHNSVPASEHESLSKAFLSQNQSRREAVQWAAHRERFEGVAVAAIAVPLALLLPGLAVRWVLLGFRSN